MGWWHHWTFGPYFFEDADGKALTVNGERYQVMISQHLVSQIDGLDITEMWFQQDGATCHTARATIESLQEIFPGRVISRWSDENWPPRSCDLTPCDFFLWGFLKSKVIVNRSLTTQSLKEIRRCVVEIQPQLCQAVIQNFNRRVEMCRQSRGGHLLDVLFHT